MAGRAAQFPGGPPGLGQGQDGWHDRQADHERVEDDGGGQQAAEQSERLHGAPIRALFQRGIDDGTLRDDLPADHLNALFGGLVLAAFAAGLPQTAGIEQAAAVTASMFLDGSRRRPQN